MTLVLILYPKTTPSGQLNIELTGLSGPIIFSFVISWFVGEVFGGALEVSLNTVLLSAACDEEMFAREQRFIEADLLEFMDGIGEEQNLYHKENKVKIRAWQRNGSNKFSTGDETDSNSVRIVPDNLWGDKSNKNTGLSDNTWGPLSSEGNRYQGSYANDFDRSRLEEIEEVSVEEENVYGRAAKYVD